jgi:hypothetical protein
MKMKLWTVQAREFVEQLSRGPICGAWNRTPQNWRGYYRWMAMQWNARVHCERLNVPIWCWHSCNGIEYSCPTVGTIAMLMGDWNFFAVRMTVLEIDVPQALAVLSSYSRWNDAIDHAIYLRSDSIDDAAFADMFDSPLIRHDTDDIQAVIPRIEPSWVVCGWSLPAGDADKLDWDMPCSEFPKTPERSDAPKSPSRDF